MGSKRKFKRDYIILESKDANFRNKERVLPKAFAKVEVNDDKSVVALYVENLKYMKEGYKVVAIRSDYETIDLGKIVLSEQGKGEFVLDLGEENYEIKAIALLYERTVPLIGFKGNKIENYEEILFMAEDEAIEEYEIFEEIEYIESDEVEEDDLEEDAPEGMEEEDVEDTDEDIDDIIDEGTEDLYFESDEEDIEEIDIEEEDVDLEYESDDIDDEILEEDIEDEYEEIGGYNEIDNYQKVEENNQLPRKVKSDDKKHKKLHSKSKYENTPIKGTHGQKRKVSKQVNTSQKPANTTQHKVNSNTQQQVGSLLMPRQIKKGLKYFKEVKPFVSDYIEDTRWWKIEINPTTMCGCVMPYLGYVNALNYTMYSDAVMNSYKYRHYLFGVQYDEYNKRKNYIYAVPGDGKDKPDNGSTGFNVFQPCDNRNNSLGYWLCFVDSRYRRIVK